MFFENIENNNLPRKAECLRNVLLFTEIHIVIVIHFIVPVPIPLTEHEQNILLI